MECSEITEACRKPTSEGYACDWDNPGLLAGRSDKEVREIYIALDATDKMMEAAMASGADILLTHHPLIFEAIKEVNDQNFITRRLVRLAQADIFYHIVRTNFDVAPSCTANLAARRLGLSDYVPLETLGEMDGPGDVVFYGVGKSGVLKEGVTVGKLAAHVKDVLGLSLALVYGGELMNQKVSRISVYPGAGGSEVERVLAWGTQVLITGNISHHQGIDVATRGIVIIDGDHYGLGHTSIPYMAEFLRKDPGGQVELEQAPPQWPAVIV